ncbi:hypothetical protein D0Y65_014466 [Glycine soja]|uniref:Uncharacterized protein n=1 Tax=Glycine soja TaxID=3848 RepID=A0A445K8G9_GLYSO|nr:hypothetical protein D0Y65_014466 [Glycine soja]
MDTEQEEMQFMGLYGVYRESYKIIFAWSKVFNKITLTLILPLSFIFLIHIEVSNILFGKILHNTQQMMETPQDTPQYHNLTNMLSSEWAIFILFKLLYFTFLLIFSLLSTSAVVYTVASIYTSREVTFSKVMNVVPKVWKRLMVTFLCTFVAFFAYNVMTLVVFVIWALAIGLRNGGVVVLVVLGMLYFAGFVYLTVVWQLASVVTVLEEDTCGVRAMMKTNELIKGRIGLTVLIFLKLVISFGLIQFLFKKTVVQGWKLGSVDRTIYGVVCLVLFSQLYLFQLVIQTVLYFVCKSYHHQNIDKSALSDHLEVYHAHIFGEEDLTQITFTLNLPLSFIFLIHIQVSDLLFGKITHDAKDLTETLPGTPQHQKLLDTFSSDWATFFLFKLLYFVSLLIFSLLSTSAIVYTVASFYTGKEVTFKKVLSVVPKLWKRLMFLFSMVVVNGWKGFGLGSMDRTHCEIVDKSALSYHLEVYECYEPLKTKDVQLDYHV